MAIIHDITNQRNQDVRSKIIVEGVEQTITFSGLETKEIPDAQVSPSMQVQIDTGTLLIEDSTGFDSTQLRLTSTDVDMAGGDSVDFTPTLYKKVSQVPNAYLYVKSTNEAPEAFSQNVTMTYYWAASRLGEEAYWRATEKLVASLSTNVANIAAGATVIPVTDGTDYAAEDLLYVAAATPFFVRIESVNVNDLTVMDGTAEIIEPDTLVSKVIEFGNWLYNMDEGSEILDQYGRIEIPTGEDVQMVVDIYSVD